MQADLKSLDSPDTPDGDLVSFRPDNAESFAILVTATVGPAGDVRGGDLFDFTVCTATWLISQPLPKGFAFQRHLLVLERWDAQLVERAIVDLCRRTVGESWHEIAQQLSRYGRWEFEGYREST
jgi:hypothetical protein